MQKKTYCPKGRHLYDGAGACTLCGTIMAEAPAPAQGSPSKSSARLAAQCPECASNDTEWHCSQQTTSSVADGRLRMSEVSTVFTLGCNSCSETIRTMTGDEVAQMMNR
jgi:hypothetical protein